MASLSKEDLDKIVAEINADKDNPLRGEIPHVEPSEDDINDGVELIDKTEHKQIPPKLMQVLISRQKRIENYMKKGGKKKKQKR